MTVHEVSSRTLRSALVTGVLVTAWACAAAGRDGQSSAFLIMDALEAAAGARPTTFGHSLASDVQTSVGDVLMVLEDAGRVTLRLAMKDPSVATPSAINFVTLRGYRVTFSRSDGRNTPGLDVPYPFDGALTVTVRETVASASFVLVRLQAKLEAPLSSLIGGGGAIAISTFADVEFYGVDQVGRAVTVAGRISVNFADWGDV